MVTNYLKVTPENPFFYYNEYKIVVLYDPPHLLKSIRNNLQEKDFILPDGSRVKWEHLEMLFKLDSTKAVKKL